MLVIILACAVLVKARDMLKVVARVLIIFFMNYEVYLQNRFDSHGIR